MKNIRLKIMFCLLLCGPTFMGFAQQANTITAKNTVNVHIDSGRDTLIEFLLQQLDRLQVRRDNTFLPGAYPSYINHREKFKKRKKDITIFYNILIDATLIKLRPHLNTARQAQVDQLVSRSRQSYPRFFNGKRGTYNFWRRDSAYRFPYSWWIPLLKKDGAVPDDMDDTVLSQLVWPDDRRSAEKLHQSMQPYTNRPGHRLKTTSKVYQSYGAYSTWFGEKFPVVFDAAVLSNILLFVQHNHLDWTAADSASLQFIIQTIKSKDYITRPILISPYYGKTSILLYHYSRLMEQGSIVELDSLRPELIAACHRILDGPSNKQATFMEKVITANALVQFGEPAPALSLPRISDWKKKVEHSDYAFFIGNIPSYLPNGIKKFLTKANALLYYHFCPAYNDLLVLQYLVEKG